MLYFHIIERKQKNSISFISFDSSFLNTLVSILTFGSKASIAA